MSESEQARTVVVLGAGSHMGRAIASEYARQGRELILAGRDVDDLARTAQDLTLRFGVRASAVAFDALKFDSHEAFIARVASDSTHGIEGFVWCVGAMPEEDAVRADVDVLQSMVNTNYTGAISTLEPAAALLAEQGDGFIAAITSVAGDRGRASNGLYGSSKAALSTYVSGLRMRLAQSGVRIADIRPGFVDTAMTYGRPGMFLVAPPDRVAADLRRGVERDRAVIYTPRFWQLIMLIIRLVPDFVFKRLPL